MTRWAVPFDAKSPHPPHGVWTVGVTHRKLAVLKSNSDEARLARLMLVPSTLAQPLTIRKGWTRLGKDDCFIYVSKPSTDYHDREIQVPPDPRAFFLVFVTPDGTIDDWSWRFESKDDPTTPADVTGEILWPLSTHTL